MNRLGLRLAEMPFLRVDLFVPCNASAVLFACEPGFHAEREFLAISSTG